MRLEANHTEERPQPDYRDYLEIGQNGDDDDSFRNRRNSPERELEERTIH